MEILLWIVFGLLMGYIYRMFSPSPLNGEGKADMLMGILGSLVGGGLGSIIIAVFPSLIWLQISVVLATSLLFVLIRQKFSRDIL